MSVSEENGKVPECLTKSIMLLTRMKSTEGTENTELNIEKKFGFGNGNTRQRTKIRSRLE